MASSAGRVLTWAAVVAVFALMTLGNIVSATGSGLACPDWPLCHGHLIPPLQTDVLIEYSHRLAAALASVLLVAASIVTIRQTRSRGRRRIGIALLVLLALQIGLGGITVLLRLPHLISTAHLVNALLILAGLLLLASPDPEPTRVDVRRAKLARLARAGLAALLVQLALGGYVRHAGAGLACPDFPLCTGRLVPEHWLGVVHFTHRWLGVILLGLFVHIAMVSRRTALARAAGITAALAVLQISLGIGAVLLQLTPAVRALHAAVGYALWAVLVYLSARAGAWNGVLPATPPARESAIRIVHA